MRGTLAVVLAWLAAQLLASACWLAPAPAVAANAAEAAPPPNQAEGKRRPPKEQPPTAPNTAEGSSSQERPQEGNESGGTPEAPKVNEPPAPNPEQPAAPETPPPPVEGQPAPETGAGNTAEKESQPAPVGPPAPGAEPAPPAPDAAPSAAAPPGVNGAEAPTPDAGGAAPTSGSDAGLPVPPSDDLFTPPGGADASGANAAEARPSGSGAGNVAEPPVPPEYTLPPPGDVAGEVEGYTAPTISLEIPTRDLIPARPGDESYYSPERLYLEDRPLPAKDIDQTDEELLAQNIEESLKLLDLSGETRPEGGISIPLPSGELTFKAAQSFQYDRRKRVLRFEGDVELVFNDIAVWADLVEVNDSAATAYANGMVAIQQRDEILFCDEAYLNYDTETLDLYWVEGNSSGPRINGRLFYEADRAWGTLGKLELRNAKVTTCDPFCGGGDEYYVTARRGVVKRDTSIVLHDAVVHIKDNPVFYLPLLAFPMPRNQRLTERESDIQQNYGYNSIEGWFAKFGYTYSTRYAQGVNGALLGFMKLDLTQRQGPGFGIRQDFYIPALGVTSVRTFYQRDWPEMIATDVMGRKQANDNENVIAELTQELNLSRELRGNLSLKYENTVKPAYGINQSTTRSNNMNNQVRLNYNSGDTTAAISGTQSRNITGGYTRSDQTREPRRERDSLSGTFSFTQNFSKELKFNLSQNYSATKGGGTRTGVAADQEGTFQMDFNWTGAPKTVMDGYRATLRYLEQGIDYDGDSNTTDNNATIRKERPSFAFFFPKNVIGDGAYFNDFSINVDDLVSGRRRNPDEAVRIKLHAGGQEAYQLSPSARLDTRLSIDQYWYDDGNAQYELAPTTNFVYDPQNWFRFDAGWNMRFRQGVRNPPVQSDRQSKQSSLNYGMTFTNRRSWRWQLRSGYNFIGNRWNNIASTFNWDPNRVFGLTQTVNFDIERKRWSAMRTYGYVRSPHIDPETGYYNWYLALTMDNDIEEHMRVSRFDLTYFRRYKHGWSGELTGSFRDGTGQALDFSRHFLSDFVRKIALRKTNCCTTMEFGYRTGIDEYYFNLYLNALPQYPGLLDVRRPGEKDKDIQFYFPQDSLRNDILTDMFGITASQWGIR